MCGLLMLLGPCTVSGGGGGECDDEIDLRSDSQMLLQNTVYKLERGQCGVQLSSTAHHNPNRRFQPQWISFSGREPGRCHTKQHVR